MIPAIVYVLLVAHFIADFLAQTAAMALGKSKSLKWLSIHVGVYTAVLGIIVAFSQPPSAYPYTTLVQFGWFVLVNAAAHFVQDAITSRITSALWFVQIVPTARPFYVGNESYVFVARVHMRKRHWFFVTIGFDQLLHYMTLFMTAGWWLR